MADKELGKLSPEQVQKLANTISEAKDLTSQQEEIIKRVLAGETEIGNLRISSLEKYFDIYSKNLDLVARKHSALNDAFLILDKKLNDNHKKLSSDINELERQLADQAKLSNNTPEGPSTKPTTASRDSQNYSKQLGLITELLTENRALLNGISNNAQGNAFSRDSLLKAINNIIEEFNSTNDHHLSQLRNEITQFARTASRMQESQNQQLQSLTVKPQDSKLDTDQNQLAMLSSILSEVQGWREEYKAAHGTDTGDIEPERFLELLRQYTENNISAGNNNGDTVSGGGTGNNNVGVSADNVPNGAKLVNDTIQADTRADLTEPITIFDDIAKWEEAKKAIHELNEAKKSGDKDRIKQAKALYNEQKQNWQEHLDELKLKNKEYLEVLEKQQEKATDKYKELELAKSQTQEQLETRLTEFRLDNLNEILDAEIKVQNLRNGLTLEREHSEEASAHRLKKLWLDSEKNILDAEEKIQDGRAKLDAAQSRSEEAKAQRLKEFLVNQEQEVLDAKIKAQEEANNVETRLNAISNEKKRRAFGKQRADEVGAQDSLKESQKRADQIAKYQAQRELYYKQKNNGILSKEDAARVQKELKTKFVDQKKNEENLSKERRRLAILEYQDDLNKQDQELQEGISNVFKKGATITERKQALYELSHDENGNFDLGKTLRATTKALSGLVEQLETKIDQIGSNKGAIDTRLQGSNNKKVLGSYWDQLSRDMMSVGAVTPFFKQEDFANNIKSLVEKGISFDLKQRAFLMTIQEKIANTFDVADGTLLRLIRIQQEDTTAGRLGMESALNTFLNNMYETSEYLSDVADQVKDNLEEMEALMSSTAATEVEYQVQKWMGSLYSVGMSSGAVQSIATAIGQVASGQIDGLTGGNGAGNLLVMAANKAGLPIADILTDGINASDTNKLLQATVDYLAEIAKSSEDNKVVQQQLANVFGIKASDLKAATNLKVSKDGQKDSTNDIYKKFLTYDNMLTQLNTMAGTMYKRTSIGEMMSNVWENGMYTLAGSMANNPFSYILTKAATLLKDATGGIDFTLPMVMGNGLPMTFNVADLMRVGALSGGILGSIGSIVSGLGSSFNGKAMLSKMGIDSGGSLEITPRGSEGGIGMSDAGGGAQTTSGSGYVGNANGSDIKDSTMQETEESSKKQVIEAKEEEELDDHLRSINISLVKMCGLLDELSKGNTILNVRVAGYGLTSNKNTGAQGGVSGLLNNSTGGNEVGSSLSDGSSTNGTGAGIGSSTGIDLGGWTML